MEVLIKKKDVEYLIRKMLPDVSFIKWTPEGALIEVPLHKLNAVKGSWQGVDFYQFPDLTDPDDFSITIKKETIGEKAGLQLIVN